MTANARDQELLELERLYWQAIRDRDAETAMRLSDDPCYLAGAQGIARLTRTALGAMIQAARYTLRRFELTPEPLVRLLSDDVAVVLYQVHEELTVDDQPVTVDAADTSTWVHRGGRWVCALHTEALLGDPFGRDRVRARDGVHARDR